MAAFLLSSGSDADAGVFTWTGGGSNDEWSASANWSGGGGFHLPTTPTPGNGDELHFAGNNRLSATNNFAPGSAFHSISFDAGAASFNLGGNGFTLNEASYYAPQIINWSTSTQTFNLTSALTLDNRSQTGPYAVIEARNGNLVFNNAVHVGGRTDLLAVGTTGQSITFNGGISSGAEFGMSRLTIDSRPGTDPQPFKVIVTGTANNYSGGTNIHAGALQLGSNGASPTNGTIAGAINLGRSNGGTTTPTDAATLIIAGSGNQTVSNAINVPISPSGSGEKAIIATTTGNTVFTGPVMINSGLTIATAANTTMEFQTIGTNGTSQNTWIGSTSAVNAGTIVLTGTTDNTGISTVVNSGTLILAKASSGTVHAVNHGLGIESGGTVVLSGTGNDQIGDNASIVMAGGTLNTSGLSETAGALTLRSSSIIDLANGASVLHFANSSNYGEWVGTLSIYNYTGNGTDRIYFGDNGLGLSQSQLNQIIFYSDAGVTSLGTAGFAPNVNGMYPTYDGQIVPVPEPGTWAAATLACATIAGTQRKRLRKLLKPLA